MSSIWFRLCCSMAIYSKCFGRGTIYKGLCQTSQPGSQPCSTVARKVCGCGRNESETRRSERCHGQDHLLANGHHARPFIRALEQQKRYPTLHPIRYGPEPPAFSTQNTGH